MVYTPYTVAGMLLHKMESSQCNGNIEIISSVAKFRSKPAPTVNIEVQVKISYETDLTESAVALFQAQWE